MKIFRLLLTLLILLNLSCSNQDVDDNIFNTSNLEKINQDEELFNILTQIATDDDTPSQNITCINFIYPLAIFTLDENDEFISLDSVLDDEEFSLLLENLSPDYSISVSFPIETILETGEEFIINTKEELKASIDQCLGDELVGDCEALLEDCLFRVGYSFNYENPYLGTILKESDGLTTMTIDEEDFFGSWTPLLIENELHVNISFVEADEQVSEFFNYDWIVKYIDENSLLLKKGDRELVLNQRCNQDFGLCGSFHFEVCENELDSEISDFILDDYTFCILDTLEFEETSTVMFFETIEDAENNTNPISGSEIYNNTENNQSIYVKVIDESDLSEYFVEIILVSISC